MRSFRAILLLGILCVCADGGLRGAESPVEILKFHPNHARGRFVPRVASGHEIAQHREAILEICKDLLRRTHPALRLVNANIALLEGVEFRPWPPLTGEACMDHQIRPFASLKLCRIELVAQVSTTRSVPNELEHSVARAGLDARCWLVRTSTRGIYVGSCLLHFPRYVAIDTKRSTPMTQKR